MCYSYQQYINIVKQPSYSYLHTWLAKYYHVLTYSILLPLMEGSCWALLRVLINTVMDLSTSDTSLTLALVN